jgi:hypothetical protein
MNETQENAMEKGSGIAKFLLSKPVDCSPNGQRTKIVIVGCRAVGVAIGVGILFKVSLRGSSHSLFKSP